MGIEDEIKKRLKELEEATKQTSNPVEERIQRYNNEKDEVNSFCSTHNLQALIEKAGQTYSNETGIKTCIFISETDPYDAYYYLTLGVGFVKEKFRDVVAFKVGKQQWIYQYHGYGPKETMFNDNLGFLVGIGIRGEIPRPSRTQYYAIENWYDAWSLSKEKLEQLIAESVARDRIWHYDKPRWTGTSRSGEGSNR